MSAHRPPFPAIPATTLRVWHPRSQWADCAHRKQGCSLKVKGKGKGKVKVKVKVKGKVKGRVKVKVKVKGEVKGRVKGNA